MQLTPLYDRYELFIPLHHLWLGYMSELLGLAKLPLVIPKDPLIPNVASIHPKLVKADYHGSLLSGSLILILLQH